MTDKRTKTTPSQPAREGGLKMAQNQPRRMCWKCGLLEYEDDLAGCTMDILADHEYMDMRDRPYAILTTDELTARYGRAMLKARSALAVADHLEVCPEGGPGAPGTGLYRQKTMKRTRLAEAMWEEIRHRAKANLSKPLP